MLEERPTEGRRGWLERVLADRGEAAALAPMVVRPELRGALAPLRLLMEHLVQTERPELTEARW